MITYDISCDVCRTSNAFPLGTKKKDMYKAMHRIFRNDICVGCVYEALRKQSDEFYTIEEIVLKNLTKDEKEIVYNYYMDKLN